MNAIRREFNFAGVPIRILVRPSREHDKKRKKPAGKPNPHQCPER